MFFVCLVFFEFAYNAKSFAIAILVFFLPFLPLFLDGPAKVFMRILCHSLPRKHRLVSLNIMAIKWAYNCYQFFSSCKLNLIHGNQRSSQGRNLLKVVNAFSWCKRNLIHGNLKLWNQMGDGRRPKGQKNFFSHKL